MLLVNLQQVTNPGEGVLKPLALFLAIPFVDEFLWRHGRRFQPVDRVTHNAIREPNPRMPTPVVMGAPSWRGGHFGCGIIRAGVAQDHG